MHNEDLKFFKAIAYAYPSSSTATKAGFGNSGCWFIELIAAGWDVKKKFCFCATREEAIKSAEALPNEWFPGYARMYDVNNGHREFSYEERKSAIQ